MESEERRITIIESINSTQRSGDRIRLDLNAQIQSSSWYPDVRNLVADLMLKGVPETQIISTGTSVTLRRLVTEMIDIEMGNEDWKEEGWQSYNEVEGLLPGLKDPNSAPSHIVLNDTGIVSVLYWSDSNHFQNSLKKMYEKYRSFCECMRHEHGAIDDPTLLALIPNRFFGSKEKYSRESELFFQYLQSSGGSYRKFAFYPDGVRGAFPWELVERIVPTMIRAIKLQESSKKLY